MKTAALMFAGVAIYVSWCAAQVPQSASRVISGTVKGSDGTLISVGRITAYLQAGADTARHRTAPVSAPVLTDGTFRLAPVSEGVYGICAEGPSTIWLSCCEWGNQPVTVTIPPGQSSVTVSIVLPQGAPIRVRVNDIAGLLAAHERKTPGAHLLVGIAMDHQFFRPAAIISDDAAGRTYQVVVPFGRAVQISVASAHFQISDATGRALPKFGNLIPVLVPLGQPAPTILLNVTGAGNP